MSLGMEISKRDPERTVAEDMGYGLQGEPTDLLLGYTWR